MYTSRVNDPPSNSNIHFQKDCWATSGTFSCYQGGNGCRTWKVKWQMMQMCSEAKFALSVSVNTNCIEGHLTYIKILARDSLKKCGIQQGIAEAACLFMVVNYWKLEGASESCTSSSMMSLPSCKTYSKLMSHGSWSFHLSYLYSSSSHTHTYTHTHT